MVYVPLLSRLSHTTTTFLYCSAFQTMRALRHLIQLQTYSAVPFCDSTDILSDVKRDASLTRTAIFAITLSFNSPQFTSKQNRALENSTTISKVTPLDCTKVTTTASPTFPTPLVLPFQPPATKLSNSPSTPHYCNAPPLPNFLLANQAATIAATNAKIAPATIKNIIQGLNPRLSLQTNFRSHSGVPRSRA